MAHRCDGVTPRAVNHSDPLCVIGSEVALHGAKGMEPGTIGRLRGGRNVWTGRIRGTLVVALVMTGATACGQASSATENHRTVAADAFVVPKGWRTYTYGKAKISVPSTWNVIRNPACRASSSSVTLYLGSGDGAACSPVPSQLDAILVSPLSGATSLETGCPSMTVNGAKVDWGPCTSSNAAGITFWQVPSLGIEAIATSTSQGSVGPDETTVEGRVLHSIRRASIAPSPPGG